MHDRDARHEIELWTTRDGREIPLDEMTDEHVANAIRVLSAWRNGVRRKPDIDPGIVSDLTAAIDRFKRLERDRRRDAKKKAGRDAAIKDQREKPSRRKLPAWPKRTSPRALPRA